MSALYSDSNITLNQTGSTITFSNATVGLNNVSLISNSISSLHEFQKNKIKTTDNNFIRLFMINL